MINKTEEDANRLLFIYYFISLYSIILNSPVQLGLVHFVASIIHHPSLLLLLSLQQNRGVLAPGKVTLYNPVHCTWTCTCYLLDEGVSVGVGGGVGVSVGVGTNTIPNVLHTCPTQHPLHKLP